MRPQDEKAFFDVASLLKLWIIVRRTNPESLKYIGKRGYVPKPLNCKPKTADRDVPPYKVGGLVVDPELHEGAFIERSKYNKAIKIWGIDDKHRKFDPIGFAPRHGLPRLTEIKNRDNRLNYQETNVRSRYRIDIDEKSPHYGCLTLDGSFIHADYDLYDIVDPKDPRLNEGQRIIHPDGTEEIISRDLPRVTRAINVAIGVNMIQHGCNMQFEDHSKQIIDLFSPERRTKITLSTRDAIRAWFREEFEGRKSLKPGAVQ
jgi:hypothetical protein